MENMMKQMRVRFSGVGEMHEGETSNVGDWKLASQKSRSFNGDDRRVQNTRYRGRSSRELAYDYDSDYMESDEFRTAVAAAAFAIDSVEERRRARGKRDGSLSKPKSKQDQDGAVSAIRRIRERMPSSASAASNKMKNKEDDTVPVSTPSFLSRKFSELQEKLPQRPRSPANTELKPGAGLATSSSDQKPTNQPTSPATEVDKKPPQLRPEDITAEVWEKTELERIKERYDKLNAKILEWENEKKAKARKKLSKNKDKPEKKRARALQHYKSDIEMIEQIAEGARSQAEDHRRKDVIKIKKKADTIRLTGKIPTKTCLCF